ncbi:MAG: acyl-CoA desaturase [Actinomycetota bacterium]
MSQTLLDQPSSPVAEVPGVRPVHPAKLRLQRRLVLVVTIVPFIGFALAVATLWGTGLSAVDAGIFAVIYVFTGMGVTVGFHRYFTHKSFRPTRSFEAVLAVAGSMSVQGSIIEWVADHRRHHAHSDQQGDPHSPHLDEGPGIRGVLKGLWHAHMGWFFDDEETDRNRWAPDLMRDPMIKKIDRAFPWLTLLTFTLPPVLGFAFTGTATGALTAFLWGSLARIFMLHHVTWSINSICHFFGKREYDTTDHSTNNWPLALISFGESWHNNHHAFPSSAVHGLKKTQPDISAAFIRFTEKVGLVKDVKVVSDKQLAAKKRG